LIDVVLALRHLSFNRPVEHIWCLSDRSHALGQEDKFMARDVKLFDRLSDDFLAATVGIYVGGIPGIKTYH